MLTYVVRILAGAAIVLILMKVTGNDIPNPLEIMAIYEEVESELEDTEYDSDYDDDYEYDDADYDW